MRRINDKEGSSTESGDERDSSDFLLVREARLCSGRIRRMSGQPTRPVPPPLAAALARPASRDDLAKVARSELPRDLLSYVDPPKIVEPPRTTSGTMPLRADVLEILDAAWHAEDLGLRRRGMTLHLAVEPSIPLAPSVVMLLMRTLLAAAVDGGHGGRLAVAARTTRRDAELVVSLIDTRYSSTGRRGAPRLDREPELATRLATCQALVEELGGALHLECDTFSTILRAFVPLERTAGTTAAS